MNYAIYVMKADSFVKVGANDPLHWPNSRSPYTMFDSQSEARCQLDKFEHDAELRSKFGIGPLDVLYVRDLNVFKVGDGVSWSFNGDIYPGTVVKVTKTKIEVRHNDVNLNPGLIDKSSFDPWHVHREGDPGVEFVKYESDCSDKLVADEMNRLNTKTFTRRKDGSFRSMGHGTWRLSHGRASGRNPEF